ncbi:MAG TPA: HD domain-containing phosphohydrolase [Candidatus Dormibacteraeota bacterium]|nr:HD domain-containing phosphohydrolase [Candidatus Dormibacteraeota bacterium]
MSLPEGFSLGPYRIVSLIGRGGMASVYKGHHRALDRDVAIKVLPEFFAEDETYQERFHQEARSVARLNHPNILTVFDFGQEMGVTYLVLELVQGGTLAERLGRPLELEEVIRILRPIASALDYAHSKGVLHRDIKPSNILIHRDGTPVLADFGLARMADSGRRLTASGLVLGTPEYMSPEQSTGEMAGPASDRYSLAVVAYEMLTGRVPFEAETPMGVLLSHVNKEVPPTRELVGELSSHVEDALRKALAKSPGDRYDNATQFVAALTPAAWVRKDISDSIVLARPQQRSNTRSRPLPTVLVVDDSAPNRELIEACLADVQCQVRLASDGVSALASIESSPPDLVLLDVQMPGMDGFTVCRRIKADPALRLVPVVMITALSRAEDRIQALEAGADDFMSKPMERLELVARVRSALRLKSVYDRLDSAEQVIFSLAAAVEAKDTYTERHTSRVAESARHLGLRMGLPEEDLDALYRGGIIHDIGKIGVPDAVLLKPGPLNSSEMMLMRAHPEIGENILRPLRSGSDLLPIVRHHHEAFDGRGYPDGLRGTAIPLLARIVAVCDAFDALTTDRPYRSRLGEHEAISILTGGAGRQWDPELVHLFTSEIPALHRLGAA